MLNLDASSLETMAVVSRRFRDLVNSPIVWKGLFFRDFPQGQYRRSINDTGRQLRYFTPLSVNPSWRKEYLQRTGLIRAFSKGKLRDVQRMKETTRKPTMSTVITYDARIGVRSTVTHISARFPERTESGEYKGFPRLVAASTDTDRVTYSDYAVGMVEKSAFRVSDLYGHSPVSRYHPLKSSVFDVSEEVGWIGGKPVQGGVVFIFSQQSTQVPQWSCGVYTCPEFMVETAEGRIPWPNPGTVTSVWIAKTRRLGSIFKTSNNNIGALAGCSKGVVFPCTLLNPTGNVYRDAQTAKTAWLICPGIPILGIKVDDGYSVKRQKANKAWVFIVNMLGEVYYSRRLPASERHVEWHLVPQTKRRVSETADPVRVKNMNEEKLVCQERNNHYNTLWEDWDSDWWIEVDWTEMVVLRGRGSSDHIDRFTLAKPAQEAPTVKVTGLTMAIDDSDLGAGPLEWVQSKMVFDREGKVEITARALDCSVLLNSEREVSEADPSMGNNARLFAVGTSTGSIHLWNIRQPSTEVRSFRCIQTSSPAISSLALTSLLLVHGGTDGLVQAWDPLSSNPSLRTLNSYSPSSVQRHFSLIEQARLIDPSYEDNSFSVNAITLDPDPTSLRGVFGLCSNIRYFSIAAPVLNRRKKTRRGKPGAGAGGSSPATAPRRAATKWAGVIDAEAADEASAAKKLREENAYMEERFGTSFRLRAQNELTEEEQLQLAQILSLEEESRRRMSIPTGGPETGGSWEVGVDDETSPSASTSSAGDCPIAGPSTASPSFADRDRLKSLAEEEDEELARALEASLRDVGPDLVSPSPSPAPSSAAAAVQTHDAIVIPDEPFFDSHASFTIKMPKKKRGKSSAANSPAAATFSSSSPKKSQRQQQHRGANASRGIPAEWYADEGEAGVGDDAEAQFEEEMRRAIEASLMDSSGAGAGGSDAGGGSGGGAWGKGKGRAV